MATPAEITKVSILGSDIIHCGFHLTRHIVSTVLGTLSSSTYVLITDTNIANLHLDSITSAFTSSIEALPSTNPKPRFLSHVIPPGEESKSRSGKAKIEDYLLGQRCTRDTVILALGGGVIGDLVGFVAATFMRGVRLVQIPTTLLAMVDSSVGGKTAIDTPHGKNLIGAFWQPSYIFIDAAFLETLPLREFSNGMAEVVKTAAIWDEDEFAALESRSMEIFAALDSRSSPDATTLTAAQSLLSHIITASIAVKAHIVTIDERETGLRNLVNFGHTIGHAIEAVLTPTILHGECVSIGMVLEAEVARSLGILSQSAVGRIKRCLKAYGLPIDLKDPRIQAVDAARGLGIDALLEIMKIDKKNSGTGKKIVILSRIGATYEPKATVVKDEVIAKTLAEAARVVAVPGKILKPVSLTTPGSKSISNRALLLAALGKGTCRLKKLLYSDDTQVMMNALVDLKGAKFTWEDGGDTLVVQGGGGHLTVPPKDTEIYLGNAGTAARFLTTVCTLASQTSGASHTYITGNARMKQRPIGPLVDALLSNGSDITYGETKGCLPLSIGPDGLKGGLIRLAASVSSQYVSSILLCAPYAKEKVVLELTGGQVISQPYIDMTLSMMATFGIQATRRADPATGSLLDIYEIPKGTYSSPSNYVVESDASSATYPLAIAAITGSTCTVENIGSNSIQGDAHFATDVLKRMGCEVNQTPTQTTVTGPKLGGLRALGDIDMESMTDAFLTACVVAAAASTSSGGNAVTRITGIANQRVKECNRIQAMMNELAKFGVKTKELDDGLEVYGMPVGEMKEGVGVHCYDDHRVAMAFSVLGTVVRNTVIEEKRCVEKTWPNWWDDLENKMGIRVEGVELRGDKILGSSNKPTQSRLDASIFLIGMRGSGKSHIGEIAAQQLGYNFVDADAYFENKHKTGVRDFVHEHGWPAFRKAELAILEELIAQLPQKHVISLGGGIVELLAARDILSAYSHSGPIVRIVRSMAEIEEYLGAETARPAYGEPISEVARRREPWFAQCRTHEFVNHTNQLDALGHNGHHAIDAEVARFFRHITGRRAQEALKVSKSSRSYFLSLTYPDLNVALPLMEQLSIGVDAIELRVDLLRADADRRVTGPYIPPTQYVSNQLFALRRSTSLPVIFTVRTCSQGGSFPDNAEAEAFVLLDLAIHSAVEFIDVEVTWQESSIRKLRNRLGYTQIIASWHDWNGKIDWNGPIVKKYHELASKLGDIVKIIGKANSLEDNFTLFKFVASMERGKHAKSLIAINMGVEGQISRILNKTLTPITHPLLPTKAAPGQLSFAEIQQGLHLLGQLPQRNFFLFGNPISHSMSPTLHNTAFQILGLPHRYDLLGTQEVDEVIRKTIRSVDFGGASVTVPFKINIMSLLDKISPAALAIGAINTIIPLSPEDGSSSNLLYGDNTDWLGMQTCIRDKFSRRRVPVALVIGAGGTSRAAVYALHALSAERIYLYNRTRSKAQAVADAFPDAHVEVIDALGSWPAGPPHVIIGTIPANFTSRHDTGTPGVMVLPTSLFEASEGVVVDMAYKPAKTPLLQLAENSGKNWTIVSGIEVLLEQGYVQFELWTGRKCPRQQVAKEVLRQYATLK